MNVKKHKYKREYLDPSLSAKERRKIISKKWYHRHKEQAARIRRKWQRQNSEKIRGYGQKYRTQVRAQLFALYGSKCCKCGFSDERALNLDHINGAKECRGHPYRGGWRLYAAVIRGHRKATDFQLLCANCNSIKMWEEMEIFKNHNGAKRKAIESYIPWTVETCRHQLGGKTRELQPESFYGLNDLEPKKLPL